MRTEEIKKHLLEDMIPFWKKLRDDEFGGFYGEVDYQLIVHNKAGKGCILNSRILWFFSNAYMITKDEECLEYATHAYEYLKSTFLDQEYGGVYWSVTYDGKPEDTTKHTYNQAFAIYALASYYDISGNKEALQLAYELVDKIETYCCDDIMYLEAFDRKFIPVPNEKLSENGIMATRTMNTLLHVFEAYTELYRVDKNSKIADKLRWMLCIFTEKVYNPTLRRLEVFFDFDMNSLIDLNSYGHDIEASWLLDRGCEILRADIVNSINETTLKNISTDNILSENIVIENISPESISSENISPENIASEIIKSKIISPENITSENISPENIISKISNITKNLTDHIKEVAYDGISLNNECFHGEVDKRKIWWVQAEAILGFINGYEKDITRTDYLAAAGSIWDFVKECMIDHRAGSEWLNELSEDGVPYPKEIVGPWKCPYHNGRMCFEVLKRKIEF